MKKRVLSALLVLCMACSMVSTVWAANEQATSETADKPASVLLDDSQSAPVTNAPAQDQDVAEGLTAPEDEESGQQSDVDTPDASQPEQAESTGTPVEGGIEYTAALEQDGQALNVIVTAPEAAFDEGVEPKLSVSAIEDETALDTIASELEGNVEYDGFAALDISFKNEAGEEIEPNVPVTVRIELPDSIVDSGIDLSTLAVQHLAENADGTDASVEQVASVADGSIALSEEAQAAMEQAAADANAANGIAPMNNAPAANNALTPDAATAEAAAVAEFEVSGFSSFVITWENGYTFASNSTTEVEIECFTTAGEPIATAPKDISIENGTTVSFNVENEKLQIDGYTFDHAEYQDNYNEWKPISNLQAIGKKHDDDRDHWFGYYTWNYVVNNAQTLSSVPSIHLYYTKNEEPEPDPDPSDPDTPSTLEPSHSKYVEEKTDAEGNTYYDLTLDVTGRVSSSQETTQIDLVYVLDFSNSMSDDMDAGSGTSGGYSYERYIAAKQSVEALNQALRQDDSLDVQIGTVIFAGDSEKKDYQLGGGTNYWESLSVWSYPDDKLWSSTNYSAALEDAQEILETSTRDDAIKVVVFVSDGDPNAGGNWKISDIDAGKNAAKKIESDYFYAIGVGNGVGNDTMRDLANAATQVPQNNRKYFSSSSKDELVQQFQNMAAEIVSIDCSDVTITDTLSNQYAELTSDAKFTVNIKQGETKLGSADFTLTELSAEGSDGVEKSITVKGGDETVKVKMTYDEATKTYTVAFSGADGKAYVLHDGWTYSVTTQIKPTEEAHYEYWEGGYQNIGEAGTGTTSEGNWGFFSNDSATLTYTSNDEEKSLDYAKPVIQVDETYTPEPVDPNPDIRKYVDDNPDGTYDLSLDVTGTAIKEQTKLNVLYVLDESYSMMWEMDGSFPYSDISSSSNNNGFGPNPGGDNQYTEENNKGVEAGLEIPYTYRRYLAAVNAIKQLNSTLAQNDDVLDVQYALVEFADKTYETSGWSQSSNFSLPEAKWETFESGTNYVAAFTSANEALNNLNEDRRGAETVVVFITDGDPNRDTVDGSGSADAEEGISAANKVLKQMPDFVDSLYVIGVSDDVNPTNLQNLIKGIDVEANVFTTSQANLLVQQFAQMAAEIAGTQTKNAVITDTLSEYAELVNENAAPSITIKKKDGSTAVDVTAPDTLTEVRDGQGELTGYTGTYTFTDNSETVELTYTYSLANKTLTLAFPEEYSLTKDWVYTVTVNIQPSETAVNYQSGEGEPKYPDTGDANTDVPGATGNEIISSGKPGFHSNTEATLTYNDDGEKEYPNPVIQVRNGSLTIYKNITSNEPGFKVADLGNVEFRFEVQGPDDVKNKTYGTIDFDEQGVAEVTIEKNGELTIEGLPAGEYTVTEISKPDSEDGSYYCSGMTYQVGTGNEENQPQAATVSAGATTTVTIENTYAKYRTVTITKQVTGDMGDTKEAFYFTTTVHRGEANENIKSRTTSVNGEQITAEFQQNTSLDQADQAKFTSTGYTLANSESITISKLKDGDILTITEPNAGDQGYTVTWSDGAANGKVKVSGDMTITVTNNRKVVAPTGLEDDHTAPFTLMVTASAIAGLALIGAVVNRRLRRRREE